MGAAISVIPHTIDPSAKPIPLKLQAANGSTIETYGRKTLSLNIGIQRDYIYITQPFKATDSSDHQTQHHIRTSGPPAHSQPRRLVPHKLTYAKEHWHAVWLHLNLHAGQSKSTDPQCGFSNALRTVGSHEPENLIGYYGESLCHRDASMIQHHGIRIAACHVDILNQFVDITQSFKATDSGDHQTQHHIRTSGPPAHSQPRRLVPHKLTYAKEQFEQMLNDGIIWPSDSPYASLLHLVPKPGIKEFRICVNYIILAIMKK